MKKTYNGHESWNAWNVALWIGNDEGLYNLARDCVRQCKTKDEAARYFVSTMKESNISKTPDGAPYSLRSVRLAMVGM